MPRFWAWIIWKNRLTKRLENSVLSNVIFQVLPCGDIKKAVGYAGFTVQRRAL